MKRTIYNPVIKDVATFIKTAREGSVSEIEIKVMPGGGNILHYHKTYSETFRPLTGPLGVRLGKDKSIILKPGESYTVKPMQLHAFFNPSNEKDVTFMAIIEPGHEGFENSLRIIYGLAEDGLTDEKSIPKSLTHAAVVLVMSDMNAPGLLTWAYPLLKWLAKRAKTNGIERQLMAQYC